MIYRGHEIYEKEFTDEDGVTNCWAEIHRDNRHFIMIREFPDGQPLVNKKQLYHAAKQTIDIILRLDHIKYYNKPE